MKRNLAILLTLTVLLSAAPAWAQSLSASANFVSWSEAYDKDGEAQDIGGTMSEMKGTLGASYALMGVDLGADLTMVSRDFSPDEGDGKSGAGLQEVKLMAGMPYDVGDIGLYGAVGFKYDLGPDATDDEGDIPLSNQQNAGVFQARAGYSLSPGLLVGVLAGGVFNLEGSMEGPTGTTVKLQDGLLLEGGAFASYMLDEIPLSLSVALMATQRGPSKLEGEEVEDSDMMVIHVLPSVSYSLDVASVSVGIGAPFEDFRMGYPLSATNAPKAIGINASVGAAF